MFTPIIAAVSFCVLLFFSTPGIAARIETPLAGQDSRLSGQQSEAKFQVRVDANNDRKTEPKLTVSWSVSPLVNLNKSALSVWVDGQVRQSFRLSGLPKNEFALALDGLRGGFHEIAIRTSLEADGDPCLMHLRNEAWLKVLKASNVSWERKIDGDSIARIKDYPQVWARLADGPSAIHLQIDAPLDSAGLGAFLDADHLLRSWGYIPEINRSKRTVGHLRLTLLDKHTANHPAVNRLKAAPGSRFALIAEPRRGLLVIGLDTAALREAMLLFANEQSRELCEDGICSGASQIPANADTAKPLPAPGKTGPETVWQLGKTGQPNGWIARGEGSNTLRFVWQRPASWTVKEWPVLHLHANVSGSAALNAKQSTLTVRINERPVATYSFANWATGRAEIRIPRDMWSAGEWIFDVTAAIHLNDGKACQGTGVDSLWATVNPETSLVVPRQDKPLEGIAGFFEQSQALGGLPALYIANPSLDKLNVAASALYPFARNSKSPEGEQRLWSVVESAACNASRCVRVQDAAPTDSPIQLNQGFWADLSGQLRVPQINAGGTLALFLASGLQPQNAQLLIVPGPKLPDNSAIESPDYSGLTGDIALFAARWHLLKTAGVVVARQPDGTKPQKDSKNISNEQRGLRWLNFVWALVSVAAVCGLLFLLWRRPRGKKADANWEIHT